MAISAQLTISGIKVQCMIPIGTGKMGRHFPVTEKSENFVKTGKIREFYSKYWKNPKRLYWKTEKLLEKSGKFVSQL